MTNQTRDIEEREDVLDAYEGDPVRFWESKQRELVTSVVDYNLATLADLIRNEEIDLAPSFQRRFRWDHARQSRLIESFLMNVPVPPIFLNEDAYGTYSVIDGKQRLMAIADYLSDRYPLEGLEVFADINNKQFSELPSALQRVLRTRPTLRAIIVLRQSDEDIKYEVFQRLNTGGVRLNPQEIRNSLFSGPLNSLIQELSVRPAFHELLGIRARQRSAIYREMRDAEFVLRFFTFKDTWQGFSGGMRRQMDEFMDLHRTANITTLNNLEREFMDTIHSVKDAFNDRAFRRWLPDQDRWRNQVLASLYDAEMFACFQLRGADFAPHQEATLRALQELFGNDAFRRSIDSATNTPSFFRSRINDVVRLLQSVL